MRIVASQISQDIKVRNSEKSYQRKRQIVFIPRRTAVLDYTLEQYGIRGHVTLEDLSIDLIPLDKDILSLEMPKLMSNIFLDRDWTNLHTIANSIVKLMHQFGPFTNVYGQGCFSHT